MKKTGLYFGSFNPVHVGHMIVAGYMLEFTDMDEVWMVVSPQNPHKEKKSLLEDHHRLELVRRAIGDNFNIRASDIEFKLPKPSYTIETLTYLSEKYPDKEFALIMGGDNLSSLHKWKNYEEILKNYSIYVYSRFSSEEKHTELIDHPGVHFKEAPRIELSASFIRKSIAKGHDVRYMLPPAVWEYIREMHFYEK